MTSKEISDVLIQDLYSKNRIAIINNFFCGQISGEADVFSLTNSLFSYEYEIKISRSDFRADFKKTFKHKLLSKKADYLPSATLYMTANYFYYVTPKDLVKVEEVPEYAGLIYVDGSKVITVKEALKLHSEKANANLISSLLRNYTYKLTQGKLSEKSLPPEIYPEPIEVKEGE